MKKQVKLKVGQIWQVPIWTPSGLSRNKRQILDVRTITSTLQADEKGPAWLEYTTIGGWHCGMWQSSFYRWITRKKAKLIGHYNFHENKAVSAK